MPPLFMPIGPAPIFAAERCSRQLRAGDGFPRRGRRSGNQPRTGIAPNAHRSGLAAIVDCPLSRESRQTRAAASTVSAGTLADGYALMVA